MKIFFAPFGPERQVAAAVWHCVEDGVPEEVAPGPVLLAAESGDKAVGMDGSHLEDRVDQADPAVCRRHDCE